MNTPNGPNEPTDEPTDEPGVGPIPETPSKPTEPEPEEGDAGPHLVTGLTLPPLGRMSVMSFAVETEPDVVPPMDTPHPRIFVILDMPSTPMGKDGGIVFLVEPKVGVAGDPVAHEDARDRASRILEWIVAGGTPGINGPAPENAIVVAASLPWDYSMISSAPLQRAPEIPPTLRELVHEIMDLFGAAVGWPDPVDDTDEGDVCPDCGEIHADDTDEDDDVGFLPDDELLN